MIIFFCLFVVVFKFENSVVSYSNKARVKFNPIQPKPIPIKPSSSSFNILNQPHIREREEWGRSRGRDRGRGI